MHAARIVLCLTALAVVGAAGAARAAEHVVIDTLVATVDNETLSIQQLHVEAEIIARTGIWFAFETPPAQIGEKAVFEETLSRVLLYYQARKMGFGDVAPSYVQDALGAFRDTFGNDDAYRKWLTENQIADDNFPVGGPAQKDFYPLAKHFLRQIVIGQYLDKKINVQVKIGLPAYISENESRLKKAHPNASQDELEQIAHREFYVHRLRELVADLRKSAKVAILSDRVAP